MPVAREVDPGSPPARVILDWSTRYELLALGAPASSWPARMLSVGVGDQAIGGFSNALLVARPLVPGRRLGDRIVVASDGLESSRVVVDVAARLASPHGSDVTLVHALGRNPVNRGPEREQGETLEKQEHALATMCAPGGKCELQVKHGRAATAIVSAATDADASLIVMGSRRLDGLRAMGSVSRRVAHQAPCSVLLVPPDAVTHLA
ncbi:MAG: universal stress protein [Solirubrobacteraceae bacterium]